MFLGRSAQHPPLLPGVSRIRCPHTPGSNLPAPVLKRHSCVSRALSRIPIEQLPLFFFKAKPATARALLFSCPSLRVCSDAPGQFAAQYFPFLPASDLRCPSSGRTKGRFSEKPRDKSEKRGAIGENTEAFSRLLRSFSPFPTQTRGVSPVHTELVRRGETSSSDFMHKLRCFLPFSSTGKLSESIFRLHPYSFHRPFYNKTHSPRSLSQLSQNSQPKIPTCSDCPRTILYLISHFKNFSL